MIRFITVHDRHVAIHKNEFVGPIWILTVVGEIAVEIPRALEAVPDLLKLCTTDVVFEDLLSHLI